MKKIILLLLCIGFQTGMRAQDQTEKAKLLCAQDFKIDDGRAVVTDIPCSVTNHPFLVSVICQQPVFKEVGIDKINELILLAYQKAKSTIDSDHAYIPAEIKLSYNPAIKSWSLTNQFSIKRADGNTSTTMLAMDFDATGKSTGIRRIY